MKLRFYILSALLATLPSIVAASPSTTDMLLDGNAIDLLVGTPAGISEPLDSRRTRVGKSQQFDYSGLLDDEFQADATFDELGWTDAEEQPADEELTESQFLDLISETDEIERTESDDTASTEANSFDSVETEPQL